MPWSHLFRRWRSRLWHPCCPTRRRHRFIERHFKDLVFARFDRNKYDISLEGTPLHFVISVSDYHQGRGFEATKRIQLSRLCRFPRHRQCHTPQRSGDPRTNRFEHKLLSQSYLQHRNWALIRHSIAFMLPLSTMMATRVPGQKHIPFQCKSSNERRMRY